MKPISAILGILLVIIGVVWSLWLQWGNAEMTSRMIWLTFPWDCLFSTILIIVGLMLIFLGVHDA